MTTIPVGQVLGDSVVIAQHVVRKRALKMPPGYFGAVEIPERVYMLTLIRTALGR